MLFVGRVATVQGSDSPVKAVSCCQGSGSVDAPIPCVTSSGTWTATSTADCFPPLSCIKYRCDTVRWTLYAGYTTTSYFRTCSTSREVDAAISAIKSSAQSGYTITCSKTGGASGAAFSARQGYKLSLFVAICCLLVRFFL